MPSSSTPAESSPSQNGGGDKKATEHLANERTFLAWVRTSIAIIGLGFVVAKFGLWLERMPGSPTLPHASKSGLSMPIGTGIMAMGAILSALAVWHHRRVSHEIERGKVMPAFVLVAFVGGLAVLFAAAMIVYLLLSAD